MLIFQYRSGFHVFLALTIKEKMNERERSQAHALMISSICQVLGAGVGQGTPPLPVPPIFDYSPTLSVCSFKCTPDVQCPCTSV